MTDDELAAAWLACSLGRAITHEEHVRVSFALLREHGPERGAALIQEATRENSAALGVAERYDSELTKIWTDAIADAIDGDRSTDELLLKHPALLESGLFGPPRWKREQVNRDTVRRLFDAFARKDAFALRALFAEDAIWVVGGSSVVAGTYSGRRDIVRFLGTLPRLTEATYASRLVDVLASGERAAVLYRATGRRDGRELDLDQLLLFTLRDGVVTEVLALPSDQRAFDEFWGA